MFKLFLIFCTSIAIAEKSIIKFPNSVSPQNKKQRAVVDAFQHAWDGYKKYAWGNDELRPESKKGSDNFQIGLTILDSLDTAIIMGLEQAVSEGIDWIENSLNFDKHVDVNVFETTIRAIGGLLSAYHLTGNPALLKHAIDLGDRVLSAYGNQSMIPTTDVNLLTREGISKNGERVSLAEISTLQLEFRELTRLTGDRKYEDRTFATSKLIHSLGCGLYKGLCPFYLNIHTNSLDTTITMGARADSYYEYLIKQWIQTGKTIPWLKDDFLRTMLSMEEFLIRKTAKKGYLIVGEILRNEYDAKMDHLACYVSGSLVLSYLNKLNDSHLELAERIGETCHQMYLTPSGLGPEIVKGNLNDPKKDDFFITRQDAHSILRPEAIEAWFYLYRATGNKKYQDWGWSVFRAIEKHAKVKTGGYSSVKNVLEKKPRKRDHMETFFLAETLKYLYLLLADDQSILPLDKWVFNTEAHPLPVHNY
ncbi:unnamed protein product [Caenorhabditis bovis]|uniref:alpha-1,2-Mannosidase n=1 Tax=Caenorhabditis bovis TaxID=2654633 RepID=A0A8S1F0S1_9PELO|nr:unnamed protein product [Caenorhabditis bovis]